MKHRFRPSATPLEPRHLLAIIIDIDTGLDAAAMTLPGVSMYPYDFSVPPDPQPATIQVTSEHGSVMAERFVAAEAALGRHDGLIDEKSSGPDNLFYPQDYASALALDAAYEVPLLQHNYPGVPIIVAMPLAGLDNTDHEAPVLAAEIALGRMGVTICVAAGDAGESNDPVWAGSSAQFGGVDVNTWPGAGAQLGAANVLTIAATVPLSAYAGATGPLATADPNAPLPSWSNYGPATVPVAVPAYYGTSESAILGAIALGAQMEAYPQPAGVSGGDYSAATVKAVVAAATPDPALVGLVSSGAQITRLDATSPPAYVPVPSLAAPPATATPTPKPKHAVHHTKPAHHPGPVHHPRPHAHGHAHLHPHRVGHPAA